MGRPHKNAEAQADSLRERFPWATYHAGHWTKDQPTRAGWYNVATREGGHAGFKLYIECKNEIIPYMHTGWAAWFWSEPIPFPNKEIPLWDEIPLP
jgi:hypothetical protein